ncbi:hypothetical protein TNCV_203811 [Trichonephila clavipes]|nr:hypothetical protein TNCV_203811 [Trichonephila clavipes]
MTSWEYNLHLLDLASDKACPLVGYTRMDGEHLLQCTGLNVEHSPDDVVSLYWEARSQMDKKPTTSIE